ncbi:MAG: choice-of-anchor Q domain-containing protein [Dokdonella sp.]|uniref:choice-of-anchor Q domain-containing protein n=1 Tax=Dokdonella sp. TaxID=2291710 RepID=UPI003F7D16B8
MHPSLPRTIQRRSSLRRTYLQQAIAATLLLGLAALPASAATIEVTSPDDSDPAAANTCTLRQAVLSMNTGTLKGACGNTGGAFGSGDTITFAASAIIGAPTPGAIALADSADASGSVGGTLVVGAMHLVIDGSAWRGGGPDQFPEGVVIQRPGSALATFGILRDIAPAGGSLTLKGLTLRNGFARGSVCDGRADGGGICMAAADLALVDSSVTLGHADNLGGGIASSTGTVTLIRSTLDANIAYAGGGLYSHTGHVTITASTISNNSVWPVGAGGGIRTDGTLDVVDSTITGNIAKLGGGIQSGGITTVTRSVISGNEAYYHGGGLHVAGGTTTLVGSTLAGNSARYYGGGARVDGTLEATNSTIAGNNCNRSGAGLYLASTATLQLDHATLSVNHANTTGGGIGGSGNATIVQTIVSGNSASSGSDIAAGVTWTGSGNLVSSASDALGPLQDNGGPTPTMVPGPGSAAIDMIAAQDCTQPRDQRGFARPQGAGCDIGAVEVVVDLIFDDGFD